MVKLSYRKKVDVAAKCALIYGQLKDYAETLPYCTQEVKDDLKALEEKYKDKAVRNLDRLANDAIKKDIERAKKAAEPKFGKQD